MRLNKTKLIKKTLNNKYNYLEKKNSLLLKIIKKL